MIQNRPQNIMSIAEKLSPYLHRYWGGLVLLAWGVALLGLGVVRTDSFGLDEGAARSLLLSWSIADRVLNPLIPLGIPDFRALLFVPVGLYWPGSIVAAKVFTGLIAFFAAVLLYRWCRRHADAGTAGVATGLLLVAPLLIDQIDALGVGVFLLFACGLGAWIEGRHRQVNRPMGGWYFIQLFWAGATMTLHPAGLALVLALAWSWFRNPADATQQRQMFIGLIVVTTLVLGIRGGWHFADWWQNPLASLALIYNFYPLQDAGGIRIVGGALALLALILVWADRRFLAADFLGSVLVIGIIAGLAAADMAWALLVVTLVIYRGTAGVIRWSSRSALPAALATGGVFVIGLTLATSFMLTDKTRALAVKNAQLSPADQLIRTLAEEAADPDRPFRAASQWPGRTMIVTKREVYPLPPHADDEQQLLKMINGMTHLVFDHMDPDNRELGGHLGMLAGTTRTLTIQDGGVIVQVVSTDTPIDTDPPAADHAAR